MAAGSGLTEASGTLKMAKDDGNFDKYAYVSDTTSTTYFGGMNVNRGTFALESGAAASPKTEQQKIDTHTALNNLNFRKALQFAFDKSTQNAVVNGEELKDTNLRNMYTHPEFVSLEDPEYRSRDIGGHRHHIVKPIVLGQIGTQGRDLHGMKFRCIFESILMQLVCRNVECLHQ